MTLLRRLDRLEARRGKFDMMSNITVLRPVVTPSAAGPVVGGAMLRRAGEPWRHLIPTAPEADRSRCISRMMGDSCREDIGHHLGPLI